MDNNMTIAETNTDIAIEGEVSVDTDVQQSDAESATSGEENANNGDNPQADDQGAEGGSDDASDAPAADEPFLVTRHNHEVHQLNREETEDLVQVGMYARPLIEKLRYYTALSGNESNIATLDKLIAAHENVVRSDISKKVSDPELVETLVKSRLEEIKQKAGQQAQAEKDAYTAEGDNINRRLANEFVDLQKDFPDVSDFDSLPKLVKRTAAEQSIPLKYAYALHLQQEQSRIKAAEKSAKNAASVSTGSAQSSPADGTNPEYDQMMKALWG